MNILYIDHYAGSLEYGMEFRPYYLAREWVKLGHKVRIIGASFSHLRIKNPQVDCDFSKEIIDGIEYQWIKTLKYAGNGSKRAITMFQFCWKLYYRAQKIVDDFHPDVVICSSTYPLDTFPGQQIAKKSNAKLVHEIHDMWPITLIEVGHMSKWHPFTLLMQIAENSFCNHANIVVSLLPAASKYLQKHGMQASKFFHVPNGIVVDEWNTKIEVPKHHRDVLSKLKLSNKFLICFFGSLNESYGLKNLIDAAKLVNDDSIHIVFVGKGNIKKSLEEYVCKLGLMNVSFLDSVSKNAVPDLLHYMDAIYVGALKNKMFEFGICMNKLFDGMMSGKPILYSVDAPNNYVKDYHCGISVPAENVQELAKGIKKLRIMNSNDLKEFGYNGRLAMEERFNYPVLAKKFLCILNGKK